MAKKSDYSLFINFFFKSLKKALFIIFFPECKSKSNSGCFIHQAGIFGVKCFSIFYGLILVDSKSGEILMPNDLIALGFCSYEST